MALLTPKPNQIQHAQIPGATVNDNMLKALLTGAQIGSSGAEQQMKGDQAMNVAGVKTHSAEEIA
jgi:hypothetical protein